MIDTVSSRFEEYLRPRLGRDVKIERMTRSEAGLSRQTWFVFTNKGPLLLRIDPPEGTSAVPVTLRFEHDIHDLLAGTGLPVCRPLWFEEDTTILGAQFYVREFADGSPKIPMFDDPGVVGEDIRISAARELVRKLAMVHKLDWRAHGLDRLLAAPASRDDCAPFALSQLERQLDALAGQRWPLLQAGIEWLRDNPPPPPAAVALCKGSNGMNQEVWRDGEIVALSDWELAALGDPAFDWARCTGLMFDIPGKWSEQDLLNYYYEVSGFRIHPEALHWYRVFYSIEMIAVSQNSAQACRVNHDARTAWLATAALRGLQEQLHAQIAKA